MTAEYAIAKMCWVDTRLCSPDGTLGLNAYTVQAVRVP